MAIDMTSDRFVCHRCGTAYGKRKGSFPVSYASSYKGVGHLPICTKCTEELFSIYLSQCSDAKTAVRQMCRKLDLYWDDRAFESSINRSSSRTVFSKYLATLNTAKYVGKCYDDTLLNEGTLWNLDPVTEHVGEELDGMIPDEEPILPDKEIMLSQDVIDFWGSGYTPSMYAELESRRQYWMSRWPSEDEMDIGTEALIRQICSLELDINRDRAAGKAVDKSVSTLNTLLGSANLKPVSKDIDADKSLETTPLGVWLFRYENKRPLPEIDDDLKDVNRLMRYIFTWMGHLCKMLGIKNSYEKLYEDEIARLRVERPEYDGDDDEAFLLDYMEESDVESDED